MKQLIESKDWGHSTYSAYFDLNGDFTQLTEPVSGVACVCFEENNMVVLMNNEPLGGHVEPNESIEDTLKREVLEEGGIKLEKWKYFGHYLINLKSSASEKFKNKYPETALIIFFLGKGKKIVDPYGNDVINSQTLTKEQILSSSDIQHKMLLEGIKLYPEYLEN